MSKQQTKVKQQKASPAEQAIAVRATTAVAVAAVNFEDDAGRGMENVDADSVAIPFLVVLQKNSPQCDPDQGEYMPDAKPGMLFNSVTRELFDGKEEGVRFVPCAYERKFLRWTPREKGGGFKGEIPIVEVTKLREQGILIEQENRLYVADDHGNVNPKVNDKVADTRVHYILILNHRTGAAQRAVLSLASTQIKKSKQLNSLLDNVLFERTDGSKYRPATWANVAKATTIPESNEKGNWSGIKFDLVDKNLDPTAYAAARDFNRIVMAGRATVNFEAAAAAGAAGGDDGEGGERF